MKAMKSKSGIVRIMRDIRDNLNGDIMDMDLKEEKEFIQMRLSELKMKRAKRQHIMS